MHSRLIRVDLDVIMVQIKSTLTKLITIEVLHSTRTKVTAVKIKILVTIFITEYIYN